MLLFPLLNTANNDVVKYLVENGLGLNRLQEAIDAKMINYCIKRRFQEQRFVDEIQEYLKTLL